MSACCAALGVAGSAKKGVPVATASDGQRPEPRARVSEESTCASSTAEFRLGSQRALERARADLAGLNRREMAWVGRALLGLNCKVVAYESSCASGWPSAAAQRHPSAQPADQEPPEWAALRARDGNSRQPGSYRGLPASPFPTFAGASWWPAERPCRSASHARWDPCKSSSRLRMKLSAAWLSGIHCLSHRATTAELRSGSAVA